MSMVVGTNPACVVVQQYNSITYYFTSFLDAFIRFTQDQKHQDLLAHNNLCPTMSIEAIIGKIIKFVSIPKLVVFNSNRDNTYVKLFYLKYFRQINLNLQFCNLCLNILTSINQSKHFIQVYCVNKVTLSSTLGPNDF